MKLKYTFAQVQKMTSFQIEKLPLSDIKQVYEVYKRNANQRITRLKNSGFSNSSRAFINLENKGISRYGKPTTHGTKQTERQAYLNNIYDAKSFIENKTSSVKEMKKLNEKLQESFDISIDINDENYDDSWRVFHRFKELHQDLFEVLGYRQVKNKINQLYKEEKVSSVTGALSSLTRYANNYLRKYREIEERSYKRLQ